MPDTSEVTSDYSGSLSDETSTEESDDGDEKKIATRQINENTSLLWTGVGSKRYAVLIFRPDCSVNKDKKARAIGERYHLAYKMVKTESKLVRSVLSAYGFHEVHPNSSDFNLMWTGAHLKPFSLRNLQDFQKVNHFPRSYEITRKDRLYKNIERMGHTKGQKHFDFIPKSYLMPSEYQEFCAAYVKEKGSWIVKPIASSRGRGIYLINNPNQVPLEDNIMVCRYISNPLLIDGFKFDIRVYVAITSYDPLLIYLFEEGLTRFATVKYEKTNRHIKNQMMHLTNYSINKKSHDYVRCEDPTVEDYGNKWSMSAMLRYLKQEGIDTAQLMLKIEAVIIKSIIAAELPIATACRMFVPHRENCIELYGFDILVDENLKPWILEGNLSPSLACDAPLDLKIKSSMVADFFSLAGFHCVDPLVKKKKAADAMKRPMSAKSTNAMSNNLLSGGKRPVSAGPRSLSDTLTAEENAVIKVAKEQYQRRGSFVRIFPTPETWEMYGSFLEYKSSLNSLLAQRLFPDMKKYAKSTYGAYSGAVARIKSVASKQMYESRTSMIAQRYMQYERKLLALDPSKRRKVNTRASKKDTPIGIDKESSGMKASTRSKHAVKEREESDVTESSGSESSHETKSTKKQSSSAGSLKSVSVTNSRPNLQQNKSLKAVRTGSRQSQSGTRKASSSSESASTNSSKNVANDRGDMKTVPMQRVYMYKTNSANENKYSVANSNPQPSSSATTDNMESGGGEEEIKVNGKTQIKTKSYKIAPPHKNVLESLKSDGNLGKVQARQAFSAYLTKVQHRLIMEAKAHSSDSHETVSKQEEQMDLVLRFLKRAASNLHQPFSIMVPSHRLVLTDRKRILSKQLGDFIQIYNRETDQMETKNHIHHKPIPTTTTSKQSIPDIDFQSFVSSASENTLEEVLTTYTHKNKSASVFLGASKPKASSAREKSIGGDKITVNSGASPPPPGLHREAFAPKSDAPKSPYMRDEKSTTASHKHHPTSPHSTPSYLKLARSHSASSLHHQPPLSPYLSSSNLTDKYINNSQPSTMLQRRPNSAKVFRESTENGVTTTTRPLNSNSMLGGGMQFHSGQSAVNQEAIADALQRLTKRQAARQYSASVQLNALTQHLSSLNLTNMSRGRPPMPKGDLQHISPKSTSLCDLATTDPSVQSMVEPSHYNSSLVDSYQEANMKKLQRNVGGVAKEEFNMERQYKQKQPTVMSQVIKIWKKRSQEAVSINPDKKQKNSKNSLAESCLSNVPSIPDLTDLIEEVQHLNAEAKKHENSITRQNGVHSLHGKSTYTNNTDPLGSNEHIERSNGSVHFSSNLPKPPHESRLKQRPPVLKKIPRNFKTPFLTNGSTDAHAQSNFYDSLKYNTNTGATENSFLGRNKIVTQSIIENTDKVERPGSARPWKP